MDRVDVQTLFSVNLALIGIREQLFQANRQQMQQWRNIRIRLALLFKALYDTDTQVVQRIVDILERNSIENNAFHDKISSEVLQCTRSVSDMSAMQPVEIMLSAWLDELNAILERVYTQAGYVYTLHATAGTPEIV